MVQNYKAKVSRGPVAFDSMTFTVSSGNVDRAVSEFIKATRKNGVVYEFKAKQQFETKKEKKKRKLEWERKRRKKYQ